MPDKIIHIERVASGSASTNLPTWTVDVGRSPSTLPDTFDQAIGAASGTADLGPSRWESTRLGGGHPPGSSPVMKA